MCPSVQLEATAEFIRHKRKREQLDPMYSEPLSSKAQIPNALIVLDLDSNTSATRTRKERTMQKNVLMSNSNPKSHQKEAYAD